jgi:hypothetical protein
MAERFFDQSVLALDILDQALHSGYAGYSECQYTINGFSGKTALDCSQDCWTGAAMEVRKF